MSRALAYLIAALLLIAGCASEAPIAVLARSSRFDQAIELPAPDRYGSVTFEQTLQLRRSQRDFETGDLTPAELGQLFWAAQGVTDSAGHRTAPSAGALYPLEVYAVTTTTLTHYLPHRHRAEARSDETTHESLDEAAFGQDFVELAPTVLVITGTQARSESKYGALASDLVNREAGHAAQNVLLQATALGFDAVPVGGFDPTEVARLLALPPGEQVLYLIPVGRPA